MAQPTATRDIMYVSACIVYATSTGVTEILDAAYAAAEEIVQQLLAERRLRSPRFYYLQADFDAAGIAAASFWAALKVQRREGAFLTFLGIPTFLFDRLVEGFRRLLPRYGRFGAPPRFDLADLVALAVRRLRTKGPQEHLQIDFGCNKSTLSNSLRLALAALAAVLEGDPLAVVRYPTLEEATVAFNGMCEQHLMEAPMGLTAPIGISVDGTATPVHASPDVFVQQKYHGIKGDTITQMLAIASNGTIADYTLGIPGCVHDSRASAPLMERAMGTKYNPGKVAIVVDSAFSAYCNPGSADCAQVIRGLRDGEQILSSEMDIARRVSVFATVFRQFGEWGNGALKRAYPYITTTVHVSQIPDHCVIILCAIRLFNLRTRTVGFNQIRTTYLRWTSANIREQLEATTIDEYLRIAAARMQALLDGGFDV